MLSQKFFAWKYYSTYLVGSSDRDMFIDSAYGSKYFCFVVPFGATQTLRKLAVKNLNNKFSLHILTYPSE